MSSCGAFYFICFRAASCAAATSAFSTTAGAPACCPSASNSCAVPRKKRLQQRRYPPIIPAVVGVARSAVESCALSNASQPHNSCSVLHHWPSGAQHELAYKTRSLGVLRNAQGTFASSRAPASLIQTRTAVNHPAAVLRIESPALIARTRSANTASAQPPAAIGPIQIA